MIASVSCVACSIDDIAQYRRDNADDGKDALRAKLTRFYKAHPPKKTLLAEIIDGIVGAIQAKQNDARRLGAESLGLGPRFDVEGLSRSKPATALLDFLARELASDKAV